MSPGPTWAPMTGPISETNTGSVPKISRPGSARRSACVGGLDVLDDPAVGAVVVPGAQVVDHALERAPRVRTRSTGVISRSR